MMLIPLQRQLMLMLCQLNSFLQINKSSVWLNKQRIFFYPISRIRTKFPNPSLLATIYLVFVEFAGEIWLLNYWH